MWVPSSPGPLFHFQTMLKTKLNVLTLRKEPLPTVIFHEPDAIELCTTTPLMKTRAHTGCKVFEKSKTQGARQLWNCSTRINRKWKKFHFFILETSLNNANTVRFIHQKNLLAFLN
uniref:Uncharacterized protein n=1 Tax=Gopherus evgoodei TaxID=1825980 RepID=A0A8C4Y3B2_9SAUR